MAGRSGEQVFADTPNLGCVKCRRAPRFVVYGAQIEPGEPGHVALAMPRDRLTADTRRRVCDNELSVFRETQTLAWPGALVSCAAKKTDRHTNYFF